MNKGVFLAATAMGAFCAGCSTGWSGEWADSSFQGKLEVSYTENDTKIQGDVHVKDIPNGGPAWGDMHLEGTLQGDGITFGAVSDDNGTDALWFKGTITGNEASGVFAGTPDLLTNPDTFAAAAACCTWKLSR